jgi:hypothetical protein
MFVRDRQTGTRVPSLKRLSWSGARLKSLSRSGARASAGLTATAVEVHTLISIEEGICWVVLPTMFLVVVFRIVLDLVVG